MSSNIKPKTPAKEAPTEPFKRAVTGCLRAIARQPELEVSFAAERPGMVGGKARLPEPPRKLTAADAAIVRGHADSIALRMACHDTADASPAGAGRPAGARGVRGGRAGPRRGDRRAPHAGRRQEPLRHARRQVPPRQVRRGHRSRRCADRGSGRDDGARAADRPGAAAGGAAPRRAVAELDRGPRRARPRPARGHDREPAQVRRRRPRSARLARHGRRPQRPGRGGQRRQRRGGPPGRGGRGRRGLGIRRRPSA